MLTGEMMMSEVRYRRLMLFASLLFLAIPGGCVARTGGTARELTKRLDEILGRLSHTGAIYGARVADPESGAVLYDRNSDAPLIPASNMKILTAAAGLDLFGADHTFKTYLALDGDDLWIIGTGDPGIGDPRLARERGENPLEVFDAWADELARREITHLGGGVYYYDGRLDDQRLHPSWSSDDVLQWYGAPVGGLNFHDNCVEFTIFPTDAGRPAAYAIMPPVYGLKVINDCITGSEQEPNIARLPDASADVYRLFGRCAVQTTLKPKPVRNPGAFFCDAFRTHLAARGIVLDGGTRRAALPPDGVFPPPADKILAVHETLLADVLRRINADSQNVFADALCKLTGREFLEREGIDCPGSWSAGEEALRAFLRRQGIDDQDLIFADGSGLSPSNRVTARLISDTLCAMARHPQREAFIDSFARGSETGTLRERFKNFEGRVFAKTGYVAGVRALSGYVLTDDGRLTAFSIIYNHIADRVEPFEQLQDEAVRRLSESAAR